MRATLKVQLVAITLGAVAVAWFWALAPTTAALLYIHPSGWTDGDLVRHLWPFRIIQPEWFSNPAQGDYQRWGHAETLARLGAVFLGWLGSGAWIVGRQQRGRTIRPPRSVAAPV